MVKEASILFSANEFENLLETLDILSNKKEVRTIAEAESQARRGETVSLSKYLASKNKSYRETANVEFRVYKTSHQKSWYS